MLNVLKKTFFWTYGRNSWQWDLLCVLILIFIFLTPKSWFSNGERWGTRMHQSPAASTVVVGAEVVEKARDRSHLQERLRTLMGRQDLQILDVHKRVSPDGTIAGYEIDIK